ncbi:MAG: hypothetical protein RLZZ546_2660 [Bacteroidota bacterium]|jgi:endonuclease/exonuclease/phosphatase (EEP) superfamily protein YafD
MITIIAGPEVIFINQLSDYLVHIMLAFLVLGFILLFTSNSRMMLMSFALSAALCVFLKNESNGELIFPKDNYTSKLNISHINLGNITDQQSMIKLLLESDLEVISFQELTPEWVSFIDESLRKNYNHSYKAVRIDPFGKAIYSKFPIKIIDTLNQSFAFDLLFEISKNDQKFNIISTYLTPSLNNSSTNLARTQMKNISNVINSKMSNAIVLGEFNMVYWAQEIRNFREASKLNNSRKDVIPASLKVPYDHIFYSRDLQCLAVKDLMVNRSERVGMMTCFQKKLDFISQNKIEINSLFN